MDLVNLRKILEELQAGKLNLEAALARLKNLPYEDLGFAKVDHHRCLRQGFPEVIFCQGKTPDQVAAIAARLAAQDRVLATRATPEVYQAVRTVVPEAEYHTLARVIVVDNHAPEFSAHGKLLVISAGTADLPVAEEAAVCATAMGLRVERLYDVGVAGLHRLLHQQAKLYSAQVLIVVAGMEGALASVVGGLVDKPVIAVPTSVGYGASFGGLAALLGMLNSCAPGIGVVNIDNGYGAAALAHTILRCGSE